MVKWVGLEMTFPSLKVCQSGFLLQLGMSLPSSLTPLPFPCFTDAGFIMSGQRHKRMTAVRERKEAQVFSAHEKRAMALYSFEQQQQKEDQSIVDNFEDLFDQVLTENGYYI